MKIPLFIILVMGYAVASAGSLPNTYHSFSSAKRALYGKIYADHRQTFYCGCTYDDKRRVDLSSCDMATLQRKTRARRVEAEHVFPAFQFGNFRQCWRNPASFPKCVRRNGKVMKGRACCEKVDPVFRSAHNDLMNLFPAVGEVNGRRSNYNWGMISGEQRRFGSCDIEVDSSIRRAEPPETVRGDIARVMFYMAATYGFRLSSQDRQLYSAWSKMDPPDAWERERSRRIKAIQGVGNTFVDEN